MQIKEYPIQIYCRGNVSLLNNHKTIAIVGSRDSTEYGRKYAEKFAHRDKGRRFVRNGFIVHDTAVRPLCGMAVYGSMPFVGGNIHILYKKYCSAYKYH